MTRTLETARLSLRAAWQSLRRTPAHALTLYALGAAVLTLNITVFASVWAMQFKALPYPDSDRLVALRADLPNFGFVMGLSAAVYQDLERAGLPVSGLGAYADGSGRTLADGRRVQTAAISPSLFPTLGVAPALGRPFGDTDAPGAGVIVSERFWRERLAANSDLAGASLQIGETRLAVIGVMPAGFRFPDADTDVWTQLDPAFSPEQAGSVGDVEIIARLTPDATPAEALRGLNQVLDGNAALSGLRAAARLTGAVWPLRDLYTLVDREALALLLLAALLVFVLVGANICNLVAEQMQRREREWLLRESLGAGRGRLIATSAIESGAPLALGALSALLLVPAGLALLRQHELLPISTPLSIGDDAATAAALLALTGVLIAAVLLVVAMTLGQHRAGSARTPNLKAPAAGRRISGALIVVQIVVATALLGLGMLLVRSVDALLAENPGFDASGVVVLGLDITGTVERGQRPDPAQMPAFKVRHERLMKALEHLPGVEGAGATQTLPFSNSESSSKVLLGDGSEADARSAIVSAGLLEALRVPLLAGRYFDPAQDREDGEAVLVDASFVRRFMPKAATPGDAIGMLLQLPDGETTAQRRIVGVVGAIKHRDLDAEPAPAVYRYTPQPLPFAWIVLRVGTQPETMLDLVRAETRRLEPDANILQLTTLSTMVQRSLQDRRAFRDLVAGFALASVLLAASGLYAVLAFAVRQRAYEWSVRAALGARAGQLMARVLRDGVVLAATGIGLGVAVGVLLARQQADRLHSVQAGDLSSWIMVASLMLLIVLLASLLPARRAAAADPARTLREA